MRIWIALLLLVAMASPLFADRIEDVFLLTKDTNDRMVRQEEVVKSAEERISNAEQRIANIEYSFNSLKGGILAFQLAIAIFTAIATAYMTFHFVARTFREEMREFANRKYKAEIERQVQEEKYEIVKKKFCPVDGAEGLQDYSFCPDHGKKYVLKNERVRREIYPPLEKIEETAVALKRRSGKSLMKPWTWMW